MREPQTLLKLERENLEISQQVSAEATSTKILGIDFERLLTSKEGNVEKDGAMPTLADIPVIGNVLGDKTANYALYELMVNNPGYDIVLYPQYEMKIFRPIGIGIVTITTVKVTARLAKIK
jgi:hypothetical protein